VIEFAGRSMITCMHDNKLYNMDEKECPFLFLVTEQMQKFNLPAWGSLGVTGCSSGDCEPSG